MWNYRIIKDKNSYGLYEVIYNDAKEKFMKNITVEGAQLAIEIGPKILQDLNPQHFPLMFSMLQTICENKKLEINW